MVILRKGRPGFLGIGAEEATVQVSRRHHEEEAEAPRRVDELAQEVLQRLLHLMRVPATVQVQQHSSFEGHAPVLLDVRGEDLGILIGRRGQTLASLQYLVYLIISHQLKSRVTTIVDVEGYRERRHKALKAMALRMAERTRSTGQSVVLEPMPANERRIIHLALQDYPDVVTQSIGEGESRKVTIMYRKKGSAS